MAERRVSIVVLTIAFLMIVACSPRYTSRPGPAQTPAPVSPEEIEKTLEMAASAYDVGVDYFVEAKYDSAAFHFDRAVALLSRDLDWSRQDGLLGERRLLLYKCRYFLERIPGEVIRIPPTAEAQEPGQVESAPPPIEVVRNSRVERWIDYFTGDGRDDLVRWVKRSGGYRDAVLRILKEEGLPPELVNLALIESGFNPNARSRAHAVGLWQFIESTGRIYGLRIDWWVDERRDPYRSTGAAARHLSDLYGALDSWPLALAAYNCGQSGVERAVKRAHSCDFWDLNLKRETSNYVPKFMAACIIMNDPGAYGFDFSRDNALEYDEIEVEPKTRLSAIARSCGVAESVIQDLNPHLLQGCSPDGSSRYPVRIPRGKAEMCGVALAEIPVDQRISDVVEVTMVKHKVRAGDTLSEIAEHYDSSVRDVALANGISNRNRIRVGQVLSIPVRGYRGSQHNPGVHTVRKSETLSSIAALYGVRIRDLVAWNSLESEHLIYAGQRLVVSGDVARGGETIVHRVRQGETLSGIAEEYSKSLQEVVAANNLGSADVIYPDQKITIPGAGVEAAGSRTLEHKVIRGDTISEIADKYGVSVASVLNANNLNAKDRIFPGQSLLIPASPRGVVSGGVIVHEVEAGETVYSIARKYAASWKEVLRGNNLKETDVIHPGQKLMIATGAPAPESVTIHTVSSGENVTVIARKYGVSVDEILSLNRMKRNQTIYPGQKVKIPASR